MEIVCESADWWCRYVAADGSRPKYVVSRCFSDGRRVKVQFEGADPKFYATRSADFPQFSLVCKLAKKALFLVSNRH